MTRRNEQTNSDPARKTSLDNLHVLPELADLFPPTTPDENAALEQSILQDGIADPLHADETGGIIDGHRRFAIAKKHGITDLYVILHARLNDEGKRLLAICLNVHRRQNGKQRCLSTAQKREMIEAELLRQYQEHRQGGPVPLTDRSVAEPFGVSKNTVAKVRKRLEAGGHIDHLNTLRARDGKRYRACRIMAPLRQAKMVEALLADVQEERLPKLGTVRQLTRIAWKKNQRRLIEVGAGLVTPPAFTLYAADFRTVNWQPASADLGITDPPWDDIALYAEVGRVAAIALKPGKLLLCYGGKDKLREHLEVLSRHLSYVTTFSIQWKGQHSDFRRHLGIKQRWTPVLVFSKGEYRRPGHAVCFDAYLDPLEQQEKKYHPWQQSIRPALYWIEKLTRPGDLVMDFCLGGGTFAYATQQAGRRSFIGCDIDPDCVAITKARLAGH